MKDSILKNKIYLYLTEFFAGMSVMAVELGASRLLAPYFSSSQIVWTIIIGTIMIAMALGNLYGGKKADKDPNPDKLYLRLLVAAVWIALIPLVGKYVIIGISALMIFTVSAGFLVWAALAACFVVFVFPLFLLGTVTPSLVKYTVGSLDESGKVVGRLGAANTIGSIIGTFVPTFVTIPAVGTSVTFIIFAGILLLLSLIYFISSKRKLAQSAVAVVLVVLSSIFGTTTGFAFWEKSLAYEGESVYNYLQVKEDDRRVSLSTNVMFGVQSVYMKSETLTGMYYDYAMAAPFMCGVHEKEKIDVLILGMGTGTYATQCDRYFDNVSCVGVEIDDKIIDLSRTYFSLPTSVPVVAYDGRAYLDATKDKFDVIMVDAYQDITIPFQMSSVEFFTSVKDHLRDGGVMVVNMNMRSSREGSINEYLSDTIASVFDNVYKIDIPTSTNCELFASQNGEFLDKMEQNVARENDAPLKNMMIRVLSELDEYNGGAKIMTDDKAPVELLGMKVIDDLIKDEVEYYKDIYRKEGIDGLKDELFG